MTVLMLIRNMFLIAFNTIFDSMSVGKLSVGGILIYCLIVSIITSWILGNKYEK